LQKAQNVSTLSCDTKQIAVSISDLSMNHNQRESERIELNR